MGEFELLWWCSDMLLVKLPNFRNFWLLILFHLITFINFFCSFPDYFIFSWNLQILSFFSKFWKCVLFFFDSYKWKKSVTWPQKKYWTRGKLSENIVTQTTKLVNSIFFILIKKFNFKGKAENSVSPAVIFYLIKPVPKSLPKIFKITGLPSMARHPSRFFIIVLIWKKKDVEIFNFIRAFIQRFIHQLHRFISRHSCPYMEIFPLWLNKWNYFP